MFLALMECSIHLESELVHSCHDAVIQVSWLSLTRFGQNPKKIG